MSDLYTKSGVNIKKGGEVVFRIKGHVASTHTKAVLKNIGSFGGLFELTDIIKNYKNPVLVQSIDGVGTKLSIAKLMKKYDTILLYLIINELHENIIKIRFFYGWLICKIQLNSDILKTGRLKILFLGIKCNK